MLFVGFPLLVPHFCVLESSLRLPPRIQACNSITVWRNATEDTVFNTSTPLGGEETLKIIVQIITTKAKLLYILVVARELGSLVHLYLDQG